MTTTEAALRDALAIVSQISRTDFPGRSIAERHRNADTALSGIAQALSQPSPASSAAQGVLLTCLCGTVNKRTLPYDMNKPDSCDHCDCANFGHYSTVSLSPSSGEPASVAGEAEKIEAIIKAQMREWWDEICQDTGCHPLDIERQGKILFYEERHWTEAVAKYAARDILALSKPTPVEAGLREALAKVQHELELIRNWRDKHGLSYYEQIPVVEVRLMERAAERGIKALAALSETLPTRETSTETKESGDA